MKKCSQLLRLFVNTVHDIFCFDHENLPGRFEPLWERPADLGVVMPDLVGLVL